MQTRHELVRFGRYHFTMELSGEIAWDDELGLGDGLLPITWSERETMLVYVDRRRTLGRHKGTCGSSRGYGLALLT